MKTSYGALLGAAALLFAGSALAADNATPIGDFGSSWTDGWALCALVARFRPGQIDMNSVDRCDTAGTRRTAFALIEREQAQALVTAGRFPEALAAAQI